ncbi:aromatic acid decarboxylase [Snodgrassella alvi]|uniref:Flavin prenyltransferase UbiX n=1 Tax=Snodgrassella alvi SCGC AB-598-J21 TaxID=1385367 RepID=A0A074V5U0_9NEIS|nr:MULTISPECIES: flavin prenyltransferase UbiX [Snodgrassella]KEQ00546.1 3-polyprenyl-4-hydroxybenzoate decarboxylase [Snodgrassella alvi SCGC AB-598-J21]MBI0067909.1 UbiX family flavin prenyltransferase [Snodgrassella sp. M0110]MBI0076908.1 UbiX family flavin prenyltransferase [Snodgrassella sp. M0118]MBI0079209.1 UbiX family flavin prenyltransferase [Snodgrassella sp. M0112]MCT6883524.1 UbiX family flavin prenyltransferase [Snodgrassella alvi]
MIFPSAHSVKTVTLALTGASGMPYAKRLLGCLLQADIRVWLLYSQAAQIVAQQEINWHLPANAKQCNAALCAEYGVDSSMLTVFGRDEWFAPPASGSNPADAMIICPASMGCVAAIAAGTSDHLLERAADVSIKENRPLIIVPRETPLSAIHLENLLKLSRLGVCILPPVSGFYQHPQTIQDMVDFVVGRILDQLHIPHQLITRWGEENNS